MHKQIGIVASVASTEIQMHHEVKINMAAFASGVYNYRVVNQEGSLLAAGKITH